MVYPSFSPPRVILSQVLEVCTWINGTVKHQAAILRKKCSEPRSKSCGMLSWSSLRKELSKRSAFESALPKNLVSEVWEMDLPVDCNDTQAPQIHTVICFCFSLVWLGKPHPFFIFCSFQKSVLAINAQRETTIHMLRSYEEKFIF